MEVIFLHSLRVEKFSFNCCCISLLFVCIMQNNGTDVLHDTSLYCCYALDVYNSVIHRCFL